MQPRHLRLSVLRHDLGESDATVTSIQYQFFKNDDPIKEVLARDPETQVGVNLNEFNSDDILRIIVTYQDLNDVLPLGSLSFKVHERFSVD